MQVESACAMCGEAEETEKHVFFECKFSRVLWYWCSLQIDVKAITGVDFHESWQTLSTRFRDEDRQVELLR